MRTRAALTSILASMGIVVIGWNVGAQAFPIVESASTTTATGTDPLLANASPSIVDGSYTGDDVNTRYGSVQVAVTLTNGSITAVTALQLTDDDSRSRQISNYAAPILAEEIINAQSTAVRNVSGATYTTDAYLSSVQSALDQAGF